MQLSEQVAIVTGGSRGIGRAICAELARAGASVVAAARNVERISEWVSAAPDLAERVTPAALDVTDGDAVTHLVEQTVDRCGRIDILVNNAGITRDGLLMSMDDAQFDDVIETNLRSVFSLTRAACRYMVRARYGRIVNISSVAGVVGNPGQSNYAASKAGVIGFTKSVAKELARRNITCNAIAPGFITTDMTEVLNEKLKESVKTLIPCQKFGEPADIAAAVGFLASPQARYITGQVLAVDGGLSM